MLYQSKIINLTVLVVVLLTVNACSSVDFNADTARITAIKSVAVVSFTVPEIVAEESGSGGLGGLSALIGAVKSLASGDKENLGNGREVAKDAVAGFIEKMSSTGRWEFLPTSEVTANSSIKSMVSQYDQSDKQVVTSFEGTPAVSLELNGKRSEFAAKAASALGVDGVMMVDFNRMEYSLYTGVAGNGQAKAKGNAGFKLYDRDGNPVWESFESVLSEASATMISGAIIPAQAPNLHRSMGTGLATNVLKTYQENAGN